MMIDVHRCSEHNFVYFVLVMNLTLLLFMSSAALQRDI